MANLPEDPSQLPGAAKASNEIAKTSPTGGNASSASKEVALPNSGGSQEVAAAGLSPAKGVAASAGKDVAKDVTSGKMPSVGSVAKNVAKNAAENSETGQRVAEVADKAVKAKAAAGTTVAAAKGGISGAVALFGNPVTYIVAAVLVICVFLWSALLVFGHNENIDGCGPNDGGVQVGQIPMGPNGIADRKAAQNIIGSWLMSTSFDWLGGKPMTKEQAAAVIGNMTQESQLTPSLTQGGPSNPWIPGTATNAEVRAAGENTGGQAIGLIQWDGSRKKDLLDLADSKGKIWSDVTVQLELVKIETNKPYYSGPMLARGFNQPGKTVEELTTIWEQIYEVAGQPNLPARIAFAQDFMTNFSGASSVTTGGSCLMGGNFDASGAVALALSIAYPADQYNLSKVGPGDPFGMQNAPPAYKSAKIKAEQMPGSSDDTYGSPGELYASCDRFVATVAKITMDPMLPWGATPEQFTYLNSHPEKWKRYNTKSQASPGDIWVTTSPGHIIMYVGNVKGVDSIAHASFQDRVGAVSPASYLNENLVDTGGRQYAGFHFIGTPPAGASLPAPVAP